MYNKCILNKYERAENNTTGNVVKHTQTQFQTNDIKEEERKGKN